MCHQTQWNLVSNNMVDKDAVSYSHYNIKPFDPKSDWNLQSNTKLFDDSFPRVYEGVMLEKHSYESALILFSQYEFYYSFCNLFAWQRFITNYLANIITGMNNEWGQLPTHIGAGVH